MGQGNISQEIRKRRLELGFSLSELARRAGTSVAAISRYEGGWRRFEIETLRKIAAALGCSLSVDLIPLKAASSRRRVTAAVAAKRLGRFFWDHDLKGGDFRKYPAWIVTRVLEYGSLDDVSTLVALFGKRRFLKLVAESRFTSSRTERFWRDMLEMEGIECTKKSFRREAWIS